MIPSGSNRLSFTKEHCLEMFIVCQVAIGGKELEE